MENKGSAVTVDIPASLRGDKACCDNETIWHTVKPAADCVIVRQELALYNAKHCGGRPIASAHDAMYMEGACGDKESA